MTDTNKDPQPAPTKQPDPGEWLTVEMVEKLGLSIIAIEYIEGKIRGKHGTPAQFAERVRQEQDTLWDRRLTETEDLARQQLTDTRHDRDTWKIRGKAAEQVCDELHEQLATLKAENEALIAAIVKEEEFRSSPWVNQDYDMYRVTMDFTQNKWREIKQLLEGSEDE